MRNAATRESSASSATVEAPLPTDDLAPDPYLKPSSTVHEAVARNNCGSASTACRDKMNTASIRCIVALAISISAVAAIALPSQMGTRDRGATRCARRVLGRPLPFGGRLVAVVFVLLLAGRTSATSAAQASRRHADQSADRAPSIAYGESNAELSSSHKSGRFICSDPRKCPFPPLPTLPSTLMTMVMCSSNETWGAAHLSTACRSQPSYCIDAASSDRSLYFQEPCHTANLQRMAALSTDWLAANVDSSQPLDQREAVSWPAHATPPPLSPSTPPSCFPPSPPPSCLPLATVTLATSALTAPTISAFTFASVTATYLSSTLSISTIIIPTAPRRFIPHPHPISRLAQLPHPLVHPFATSPTLSTSLSAPSFTNAAIASPVSRRPCFLDLHPHYHRRFHHRRHPV